MSAWPACLARGRGWGRSCFTAVCVFVCALVGVTGIPLHPTHQWHPSSPSLVSPPQYPAVIAELRSVEPGCYLKHGSTTVYLPSPSTSVLLLLELSFCGSVQDHSECFQTFSFNLRTTCSLSRDQGASASLPVMEDEESRL